MKEYKLNITEIINCGDNFERSFFKWLVVNKIQWCMVGSNLNYIMLFNMYDYIKTIEIWPEVLPCG